MPHEVKSFDLCEDEMLLTNMANNTQLLTRFNGEKIMEVSDFNENARFMPND